MSKFIKLQSGLIFLALLVVIFAFQNCGNEVEFSEVASTNKDINHILGETPQNCVQGQRLGIWLDPDESGQLLESNYLGAIVSYSGEETVANNYNYYSASAHPIVGPTPAGFETHVFFYEGSDGLALNFYSNIDANDESQGSEDNTVHVDGVVSANNGSDGVMISDDGGELKLTNKSASQAVYEGRFQYWYNTDGGAIGPLVTNDYRIQVKFLATGDITNALFYLADGQSFTLKDNGNNISSFVIAFKDYELCQ